PFGLRDDSRGNRTVKRSTYPRPITACTGRPDCIDRLTCLHISRHPEFNDRMIRKIDLQQSKVWNLSCDDHLRLILPTIMQTNFDAYRVVHNVVVRHDPSASFDKE